MKQGVVCVLCIEEMFIPLLPATCWNTFKNKEPIPVCPMHRIPKRSVDWDEGLKLLYVWRMHNE